MPGAEPASPSPAPEPLRRSTLALAVLLAALGAAVPYALLGDFDLNLLDEGFLWYGVERVLAGEVPLRDFQAYDPGRYYWCAAWAPLFGSGILGVRAALAIFQALGLFLGVLTCRRIAKSALGLTFAAALVAAWMFPRHKLFEPALALTALYGAVRLIERPGPRTFLAAGALTGLFAWFGRNHALYAGLSFVALGAYIAWKRRPSGLARLVRDYAFGVALGSAPLWLMLAFVPGFATAYLRSLELNLHHGANLALPYPWPWTVAWGNLEGLELFGSIALSAAFLLPFAVLPLGVLAALRSPGAELARRAVALAATFVGAIYLHHVSVRSAVPHLAQCIHPLLVLALALPDCFRRTAGPRARGAAWCALGALSLLATARANPVLSQLGPDRVRDLAVLETRGEALRIPAEIAGYVQAIEQVVDERVPPGEMLFLAPSLPGLYPVLGRPSPTWWIYFFWPAEDGEQTRTIAELERGANWALIFTDARLDNRADLAFRNSNPLVWHYLARSFQPVTDPRLPPGSLLLRRRGS